MDFAAFIARSNYGKGLAVISGMGISKEALSHIRLRRTQRQQTACSGNSYCDRNIFCGLGNTICSHQINIYIAQILTVGTQRQLFRDDLQPCFFPAVVIDV